MKKTILKIFGGMCAVYFTSLPLLALKGMIDYGIDLSYTSDFLSIIFIVLIILFEVFMFGFIFNGWMDDEITK